MENIDTYIIILALVIACCSLIAVLFIYLHTRRVRREYYVGLGDIPTNLQKMLSAERHDV